MGEFYSKHQERDLGLPKARQKLLNEAVRDFTQDSNVVALYLGGSLAKGNPDLYSDIDLRVVVKPEALPTFISNKCKRPGRWGDVLFFEDLGPRVTHTVAHYTCFLKVDTFYYKPDDLKPSLWLQETKIVYDPEGIVSMVVEDSRELSYSPTAEEFERWKGKVFAYLHEVYRRVMRDELIYALKLLSGLSALAVQGWHMEAGRFPGHWADGSKVEGARSILEPWQLSHLEAWQGERDKNKIMNTMVSMVPELLRLNRSLSRKLNVEENTDVWEKVMDLIF